MGRLEGRLSIVTGASRGIGQARIERTMPCKVSGHTDKGGADRTNLRSTCLKLSSSAPKFRRSRTASR